MKISIVSPVYKAESILEELVSRINEAVSEITDDYEIILPEDGSPDKSWEKIKEITNKESKVKGIKLSRNFGQHPTIIAGLSYATGEWIVVMDCDLQDNPQEIKRLYRKAIKEKYDIVLAKRKERKHGFFKRMSSKVFYSVFSYMTNTKQDSTIANFGIYSKDTINAILNLNDYKKMFPLMIRWIGFKVGELEVIHGERFEGTTSYSFVRLVNLAVDSILSFSDKPLRLIVSLGLGMSIFSLLIGVIVFIKFLLGGINQPGYTSLMLSIWFLSSIVITLLGVIGIYIGRLFEESKGRPVFIVKEKINF
ncbi:dolichyl-phosphate beta-D-mannosyltransferase [Flavobacteriaceae bacterium UJ101]|nr:dolichyl-phosphate beta-D-mannosyltransferase [Flavobacteriaceae bacterium UJ101]